MSVEHRRPLPVLSVAVLLLLAWASPGFAYTKRVVAGARYAAQGMHAYLLGRDYRDLWSEPIEVEVLDLASFGGGLEPLERGGGRQTASLKLRAADGREYRFRSVDKDPTGALPDELKDSGVEALAQDQTSSQFPAAALVVEALSEAAGIPHLRSQLFVMGDDRRLGTFRGPFAGVLGTLEERPAGDWIESERLFKLLTEDAHERVDGRAYVRARLLDMLVGDWDRHHKQWEWSKGDDGRWQPLPVDRDQAFSRYDGALLRVARKAEPSLGVFGPSFGKPFAFNWVARDLDRRLLAGEPRTTWDEEARELQAVWTDAVIDDAVSRLPDGYVLRRGELLRGALKARRDGLLEFASRYAGMLAHDVAVYATQGSDRLEAERDGRGLRVRVTSEGEVPLFERRFDAEETREVRVFLGGGGDRAAVEGDGPIKLIVVGGEGEDDVAQARGGAHVFDAEGIEARSPVEEQPRDWGHAWSFPPWLGYSRDTGVFLGGGVRHEVYGFRHEPYLFRQTLRVGYATEAKAGRAEYVGDFRHLRHDIRLELTARASGIEVLHFYGFGNETRELGEGDFQKVDQRQYLVTPRLNLRLVPNLRLRVGPLFKYVITAQPSDRLIGLLRPYGVGRMGRVGFETRLEWDSRDSVIAPRRGVIARAGAVAYPGWLDLAESYAKVRGDLGVVQKLADPLSPTLALKVGGEGVFGLYPYDEAAFIGGPGRNPTVRGLVGQRYAGDASAYGTAELRVSLGRLGLIVPTQVGLFGFADVGRVWLDGEDSRRWHRGFGGGVWVAPVKRENTLAVTAAFSEGRTAFAVQVGFLF